MRPPLAVAAVLLLSGCVEFMGIGGPEPYPKKIGDGTGPTLWLNFTLTNLGDPDREAFLGPHCGTARPSTEWIRDGDGWTTRDTYESVFIEESTYRQLGTKRPFLVITYKASDARGAQGFGTTGQEGFAGAFPFALDPQIRRFASQGETSTPIARIDHRDGTAFVDGKQVYLPQSWERTEAGDWAANFTLSQGPTDVDVFRIESCA